MATKLEKAFYFLQETFKSLRRNGWITIFSIITVMVSVFVFGLFFLIFINCSNIASHLEEGVQLSVYLKDGLDEDQINIAGADVAALPGVVRVKTVTKKQAMERFRERLGRNANVLDALETNPLPYSFDVQVDNPDRIEEIVPRLEGMGQVDAVRYGKEAVQQLFHFTRILRYGGLFVIVVMVLSAVFIITNTIRLTVYARRREITIMRYVGATNGFIRWPFLMEGILIGLTGSAISWLALVILYDMAIDSVQAALALMPICETWPLLTWTGMLLLLLGTGIGASGSYISLRKYLKI